MDRGMIEVKLVDDKEVVIRQLVHRAVDEPFDFSFGNLCVLS